MFCIDLLGAGQLGTSLIRLEDTFPGAGHIAVLHGKGPKVRRLTGRNGKVRGIAAFCVLHKVGAV